MNNHTRTVPPSKPTLKRAGLLLCVLISLTFLFVQSPLMIHAAATVEQGIPVEENPELFITRSMPTHGSGKIAVFLIEFPDCPNDNPYATVDFYTNLYFSRSTSTNQSVESVAEFYYRHSYGKLNLDGQVFDWYTARHERAYYSDRKAELIEEAAAHYQSLGVDFSQFDGDGNGIIDSIVFHFSGEATDIPNDPWYTGLMYTLGGSIGDMAFTTIVQIYEKAGIDPNLLNVIEHELMHTLGMPDLYGEAYFGMTPIEDLMSNNSVAVNPYFKLLLGWIDMDSVQIITEDTEHIRLKLYGDEMFEGTGYTDIALITDEYHGLYDEFYLVIYQRHYQYYIPVIFHVDARLNEEGTGFLYNNQMYLPRPDKSNPHGTASYSTHLFIEELSSDPTVNYVLIPPYSREETAFGSDDVLGPNSFPSSDTHDGVYTGIRIDHFTEHNNEYLTFDVSFVEDTAAPIIITDETSLAFNEVVKLYCNEYIYEGEHWPDIRVTDVNGAPLDATVLLPHYPHHELEIIFHDDSYRNGYRLIIPDGAIRDSSGNTLAAITLTAVKDDYLHPASETILPGTGALLRDNGASYFFPHEQDLVVITGLWGTDASSGFLVDDAFIEFMRLDHEGQVLTQAIVKNPFPKSNIVYVVESGDGRYIFICRMLPSYDNDLLFCITENGELAWANDKHYQTGVTFIGREVYASFKQEHGIVVTDNRNVELIAINSITGQVQSIRLGNYDGFDFAYNPFFELSDTRLLRTSLDIVNGIYRTYLNILDKQTGALLLQGSIPGTAENGYSVNQISTNDDGTLLLFCTRDLEQRVFLLDAKLRIIRSIELHGSSERICLKSNGFYNITITEHGNHDNNRFHIERYDRYLNRIWQTDATASFLYFFSSSTGEILAYTSMLEPERACYIVNYGSESHLMQTHLHSLVHTPATSSTCRLPGEREYWYCTTCGGHYFDEGQTPLSDLSALTLPLAPHIQKTIPGVAPTCTAKGTTEGVVCTACGQVLVALKSISPTGHTYKAEVTAPTCTEKGYITYTCTVCSQEELNHVAPLGHTYGAWIETVAPTYDTAGEEMRTCTRCNSTETQSIPQLPPSETPPETEPSGEPVTDPPLESESPTEPAIEPVTQPGTETTIDTPLDSEPPLDAGSSTEAIGSEPPLEPATDFGTNQPSISAGAATSPRTWIILLFAAAIPISIGVVLVFVVKKRR